MKALFTKDLVNNYGLEKKKKRKKKKHGHANAQSKHIHRHCLVLSWYLSEFFTLKARSVQPPWSMPIARPCVGTMICIPLSELFDL